MNPIVKSLLRHFVRAARPHLKFAGLLQTAGIFDRSALVWSPGAERVLVLAPHMDDETIGCGGTIALHARRGAQVTVAFMTDGRNGGAGIGALSGEARNRKQAELVDTRKLEARRALHALQISDMRFIDALDGALGDQREMAAAKLRALLLEIRPDIVYLPFFTDEHGDHRATSTVLIEAAEGTALEFSCAGYEVWTPIFPNCFVNIDSTLTVKQAALNHYESQLQDGDYYRACMGLSAYRAIALFASRGSHAEAFFVCPLSKYRDLHAEFTAERSSSVRVASHAFADPLPSLSRRSV